MKPVYPKFKSKKSTEKNWQELTLL